MFVKYYTGPTFKKVEFCNMLRHVMKIHAVPCDDGIILDRDAFNRVPAAHIPVWAWLNKEDINSPFHTRPSSLDEYYAWEYERNIG